MEKQVKCKKCKLTYSKKKYECPYCHTRRFNPTGLIIFLVILVIAAGTGYYFFHDEINSIIANKINTVKTEEGIKYDNFKIEKTEKENIYKIQFDITNNTKSEYKMKYIVYNLADKVSCKIKDGKEITNSTLFGYDINVDLIKNAIYRAEYTIEMPEEWKTFELYIKEYDEEEPEAYKEEIKLFTFSNNFNKNTDETTK